MSKTQKSISKNMNTIFITDHSHNSWSSKHKALLFVLQTVYFTAWNVMTARASLQFNTVILVNNQLDAQFFVYVYSYSLHASGSHVPIIRGIIVSKRHLVYVTLYGWPSNMLEHMLLHTRRSSPQSDINHVSHWYNNSPDDRQAHGSIKHVENRNKHTWKIVRLVSSLQGSYQNARSTKHKT